MSVFRNMMLASMRKRRRVSGFVGGWKAYGRSNSEDPATRDILPDYSGNGRDIKLYNFDFTESSGYSGGGLVSDGIDDYGQCIKGFSLPDDYTVVAIRKYPNGSNDGMLLGKINTLWSQSAFCFEHEDRAAYSFGTPTIGLQQPALFSYQTKNSYNGTTINFGDASDTDSNGLWLFHSKMNSYYKECVLYDLRIYDHSLSAEELQIVKDEMMSDYEKATGGGIADIHYVADWDAKGRSNDEDADVRNKWIDKATGKVINLNNFAYAGMSGWNGYAEDFLDWESGDARIKITNNSFTVPVIFGSHPVLFKRGGHSASVMRIKVSGLTKGKITYLYNDSELSFTIEQDGVYDLPESVSAPESTVKFASRFQIDNSPNVTVEQLPLYPGALVGDGVDDYGVTQEAINEEVGTVLLHYRRLVEVPNRWGYYTDGVNQNRLIIAYYQNSPYFYSNLIAKHNDGNIFIGELSQAIAGNTNLHLMANTSNAERGQVAIYRLILIREKLNETQIAYLVNKVQKEYNDWCKANGYDYAIING